jgi:predicted nucleic acid-binding protein
MLVLDANILIRGVLEIRVLGLLRKYAGQVEFAAPDVVFQEVRRNLPPILDARKTALEPAMVLLGELESVVRLVELEEYGIFEAVARERIERRDKNDWPVLATALALNCPIWTEDLDFFGCGVATWTTDRVEIYLESKASG